MIGLGTLVNVAAVIVGGVIGVLLHGGLKKRFQDILMQALGLATMFIGAAGVFAGMLKVTDTGLTSAGATVVIASLVLGAFLGECIDIESRIERFGEWLKKKARSSGDPKFVEAFVSSTLVVCVGAMAVVGSLEDGIQGNPSTLYTKAALDFVIVLILASMQGKGTIFAFIPLGIFQGLITLFARFIEPILTETAVLNLSFVGSILIFSVGINLCFGKKIKVGNMLPAVLLAIICGILNL